MTKRTLYSAGQNTSFIITYIKTTHNKIKQPWEWRYLSPRSPWDYRSPVFLRTGLQAGQMEICGSFGAGRGTDFSLPQSVPIRFSAKSVSNSTGNRGAVCGNEAHGAWRWPLTLIYCWCEAWVELYLLAALGLHVFYSTHTNSTYLKYM